MKIIYRLFFYIGLVVFSAETAQAQMVSDNIFLQGQWLEACIAPNGCWGNTVTIPAGYHTNPFFFVNSYYTDPVSGTPPPTSTALDFSYNVNHDGWATTFYGPYFMPGTPFDGWSMQVNGVRSDAYYTDGGFYNDPGGTLGGTVTSYQQIPATCNQMPSMMIGTWTGKAGLDSTLRITQTNRLDTNADWLVVTTTFVNKSTDTMNGLYYFVDGDPDNDEVLPGGSFPTNNHIAYQGDAVNRHEVWGRPPTLHQNAFSGLATKDCRAKALIYAGWSPHPANTPGNSLDNVWNETVTGGMEPTYYTLGATTLAQDIAYGLIFNLGSLNPGDSTVLSFAWIFSDTLAIDSAFPGPKLSTQGMLYDLYDTVNSCSMSGCGVLSSTSFIADIIGGDDKDWSYSHWTWSPSYGLSSSTGTHVTITTTALGGVTTFTITGTKDVAHGQCGTTVLYLTVLPCVAATSNSPGPYPGGICMYDTLKLFSPGDSLGASYMWYGPGGGFLGATQNVNIPPWLSWADTGWYFVVKTVGFEHDTARTFVMLDPIPYVTATSNSPVCSGNTLDLFANPDSAAETFSWTGPNGFVSGLQNPTIPSVPVKDSGLYKVKTDLYGCFDSGYVDVEIDSAPVAPIGWSNSPGLPGASICQGDTLKLFAVDSTPGVTYTWKGPILFYSVEQNPMIPDVQPAASGIYTVIATLNICSDSSTTTVNITPTPTLIATNNGPVCSGVNDTLLLQAVSVPGATFTWTGPYVFYSLNQNPYRTPVIPEYGGIYQVRAVANNCPSALVNDTVIVRQTPNPPVVPWLTFCQDFAAPPLQAMGDSIMWYPVGTSTGVTSAHQRRCRLPLTPALPGTISLKHSTHVLVLSTPSG